MQIEYKIKQKLNKIRPFLQRDGGDVEFVEFKNGIVFLKMSGACKNCAFLNNTNNEIKTLLIEEIEEVKNVILV